mmetsp:Transcript_1194/g.2328  ORF Transcript_1194/g.2328 Transcript_1194/m.2328 type:complete len:296 (-) Transcript_1194:1084-1971(-)
MNDEPKRYTQRLKQVWRIFFAEQRVKILTWMGSANLGHLLHHNQCVEFHIGIGTGTGLCIILFGIHLHVGKQVVQGVAYLIPVGALLLHLFLGHKFGGKQFGKLRDAVLCARCLQHTRVQILDNHRINLLQRSLRIQRTYTQILIETLQHGIKRLLRTQCFLRICILICICIRARHQTHTANKLLTTIDLCLARHITRFHGKRREWKLAHILKKGQLIENEQFLATLDARLQHNKFRRCILARHQSAQHHHLLLVQAAHKTRQQQLSASACSVRQHHKRGGHKIVSRNQRCFAEI